MEALQAQLYRKMLVEMAELLQKDMDVALYLTDTEKCLEYLPGRTIDAGVRRGDIIRPDEPIYSVIHNRRNMDDTVPKDVFGFAFRGIGKPLLDKSGNVIGALAIAKSIENQIELTEVSSEVASSLEHITDSTQEMSSMMENLSGHLLGMTELSDRTEKAIREAGSIMNVIQSISVQSNLLALNASIEAARAGEAGKSFSVVAKEMKKLSEMIQESSSNVAKMLDEMKASVKDITEEISKISASADTQVEVTSQISSSVLEVARASEQLVALANKN